MRFSTIKHENILYALTFLIAFALRFIHLGALPLSDAEAEWALQALRVVEGTRPLLGPQPGYILPTSVLFFFFGTSNFLARFLPALTGSALVFFPYLFRERLKPVPALLLAFFLALDPGLVSLSRQAGSLILALTFVLLSWAFWWNERPRWAGVFGGLALLSGPSVWMGLLGLALAWVLRYAIERPPAQADGEKENEGGEPSSKDDAGEGAERIRGKTLKDALIFGGGTILLVGTMFFLSPNGLSAWLKGLPVYLAGWLRPSGVPAGRLFFAVLVYEPLAVLFGLIGVIRGWWQGRRSSMLLSLWLLVSLLLVAFYPARQVGDLAWVLVPLWALAALELSKHMRIFDVERREVGGVVFLLLLLSIFSWLNFTAIALDPQNPVNSTSNIIQVGGRVLFENFPPTRYILLFSILLLMLVSMLMVALGWSARTARLGSVWGLTIALGIYSLGATFGATGLRTPEGWELWWPDRQPVQADLLLMTVDDQSEWSTGDKTSQAVTIWDIESPALEWLLRDREVDVATALDMQNAPAIIVSQAGVESPNLPIAYRGQDFNWRKNPSWEILNGYSWIKWSVFRNLPYDTETVILWVRNDLFIDTSPSVP